MPLPYFTTTLAEECDIAEGSTRSSFGFIARHAFFHQFIGALVNVFLDGDRDVVIAAISGEEAAESWQCTPPEFWLLDFGRGEDKGKTRKHPLKAHNFAFEVTNACSG